MRFEKKSLAAFFDVKRQYRFYLVFILFISAFFYHYFAVPPEILKNNKAAKEQPSLTEKPDLDSQVTEKVYAGILQSQPGDFFRIGASVKTKKPEVLELFVRTPLNEVTKVGEWKLLPSPNGEYQELIFSSSKWYEDVIIRLKKKEQDIEPAKWDEAAVILGSFFVHRIEIENALEVKNLEPTIFGISTVKKRLLTTMDDAENIFDPRQWTFEGEGNFLQALEFSGTIVGGGRQEYAFELLRVGSEKNEKSKKVLQRSLFTLDSLRDIQLSSGNYRIPIFSPLREGQQYMISLVRSPSSDRQTAFKLGPLRPERDAREFQENMGNLALHLGRHYQGKNQAVFPDGAKLEDLGESFFYSFSIRGNVTDYTNIFDMSEGIIYDWKKRLVAGKQSGRQYFTYRFDTVYPFDQLVIEAQQEGNDEDEIKLEYSFDNAFWQEISYIQEKGAPQKFLLTLDNNRSHRVLSVRASYHGENKNSGFFALKSLSVNALVPKPK